MGTPPEKIRSTRVRADIDVLLMSCYALGDVYQEPFFVDRAFNTVDRFYRII